MEKKRGVLYWLRCIALIGTIFFMLRRCTVPAFADEITLTPEQTYALLGQRISCLVHSRVNNQDVILDASAVFSRTLSSNFTSSQNWGSKFYFYNLAQSGSPGNPSNSYPSFVDVLPNITDREYLIFFLSPSLPNEIPIGWPSWSASDSNSWHDLTCDFSLPIQSCTDLKMSILYSASAVSGGYYGNINNSTVRLDVSTGVVARHPIGQNNINTRFFILLSPFYKPYNSNPSSVPEANRVSLAAVPLDYHTDNYDMFSVSGFSASLNMVNAFYNADEHSPFDSVWPTNGFYTPLLYVQCPTISDYVPATTPPVTTRPPDTLRPQSSAAHETVDLSHLETGVADIVGQLVDANDKLDWIGNNVYIGVNNLAYISYQLDLIYQKMWDAGEIPEGSGLRPPSELRSDIHDSIQTALHTSYFDSSYLDEVGSGFSFFNDLFSQFTSGPLAFFGGLGSISLIIIVLAWFIFRGRG